jgi:hypothetical protein
MDRERLLRPRSRAYTSAGRVERSGSGRVVEAPSPNSTIASQARNPDDSTHATAAPAAATGGTSHTINKIVINQLIDISPIVFLPMPPIEAPSPTANRLSRADWR